MPSSKLIRGGAIGFVLAGLTWLISGLLEAWSSATVPAGPISQEQVRERILNLDITDVLESTVDIVGLLLLALGLIGLHALQKESYGRLGRAGFHTALAATVVRLLVAAGHLVGMAHLLWRTPLSGLLGSVFLLAVGVVGPPAGFLGSLAGFALLGVATLRTRILPLWYGTLLIVLEPVAAAYGVRFFIFKPDLLFASLTFFPAEVMAFRGPSGIWRGLVLVVLGYVLWRRRGAAPQQPS